MNVLFDTNVLLGLLLAREPHDREAVALLSEVAHGRLVGLVGATSVTTVHSIAQRALGAAGAAAAIRRLLQLLTVAPVTHAALDDALGLAFRDFEDAVLDAAASHAGLDAIVTRDAAGFAASRLRVFAPAELLAALRSR